MLLSRARGLSTAGHLDIKTLLWPPERFCEGGTAGSVWNSTKHREGCGGASQARINWWGFSCLQPRGGEHVQTWLFWKAGHRREIQPGRPEVDVAICTKRSTIFKSKWRNKSSIWQNGFNTAPRGVNGEQIWFQGVSLACVTAMPELSLRWCRCLALPACGSAGDTDSRGKCKLQLFSFQFISLPIVWKKSLKTGNCSNNQLLLLARILLFHLFYFPLNLPPKLWNWPVICDFL